ncbi:GGDEF domain-containing protein [Mycobacterium sp.]|uniref:GGDEF domain-containing protein n=1 Tax=Mycobacterium sp. TaxID=1785 RepID=UPI003D0FD2E2
MALYLNTRGIRLTWRALIAAVIAAISVIPAAVLAGPTLPRYPAAEVVGPAVSGAGLTMALLWLIRWPTRVQSLVYALTGSICITGACLVQRDPLAGMLGCCAFAVLGGYIAFFHTAQYTAINFVIAMTTAVTLAGRLVRSYDIFVAGGGLMLILVLNVAFPFAVQWLVHSLASELRQSSRDPLTGLLIRRAFYQSTYGLLLRRRQGPRYLAVAMIDLDNFKRLNDTQGHAAGDEALVAVAGALRLASPDTSIIARFGGEEFVVADIYHTDGLHDVAEHLRNAVGATRYPVTASIGIISTPLGPSFDPAERELINDLINAADSAMYAAKRAGGNQSRSDHLNASPFAAAKGSAA